MTQRAERRFPRTLEEHRRDILVESALIMGNIFFLVWVAIGRIPAAWTADPALRIAFAISSVLVVLTLLLGLWMLGIKIRGQYLARKDRKFRPAIAETLTGITLGSKPSDALDSLYRQAPQVVARILPEFLAIQKGAGQVRLAETAERLGLTSAWRKQLVSIDPDARCRAITWLGQLPAGTAGADLRASLDDPEELVSVIASRGLTRDGRMDEVNAVFESLPRQTILVRALISPTLRKHASILSAFAMPHALASGDRGLTLATLELIRDWQRAIPAPGVGPLLRHSDERIREYAFRALPWSLEAEPSHADFESGVESESPAVRIAALTVAARMRREDLTQQIAARVSESNPDAAFAAAWALTSLNRIDLLENIVMRGGTGAAAATEALERFRMGRLPW